MTEDVFTRMERVKAEALTNLEKMHAKHGANFIANTLALMVIQTIDVFEEYGVSPLDVLNGLETSVQAMRAVYLKAQEDERARRGPRPGGA